MIAALRGFALRGLGDASLTPLVNTTTGGYVYATYSDGTTGPQLYQDASGNIVDADDNQTDGYTGNPYSGEITVPYQVGGNVNGVTPGGTVAPTATPSSTPGPQSPSGSTLTYTATWNATVGLISGQNVVTDLADQLPGQSLQVISSQSGGNATLGLTGGSVTVVLQDNIGHAKLSDVQAICDSIVKAAVGGQFTGSQIALTSTGTGSAGASSTTSSSLSGSTGMILAIAGIGIVALLVLKK